MNFKQDSEKGKLRAGETDCDLTHTHSQRHPYLPEEIPRGAYSIPDYRHHFHFYNSLKTFTAVCQGEEGGGHKDLTLQQQSWVLDCCSHAHQATLSICRLDSETDI